MAFAVGGRTWEPPHRICRLWTIASVGDHLVTHSMLSSLVINVVCRADNLARSGRYPTSRRMKSCSILAAGDSARFFTVIRL